nr:hypothetical protein [Tanacetum cinerariifolium]GEY94650.1 hypothetical protein [Tanacetum cinerariifolium]
MILQTFSTYHHSPRHTLVSYVETIITTYSDGHQPPKKISIDELKTLMQSYCEIISQRRKQAAQKEQELLEQEQTVEEKQELLAEEQATNPSDPSSVSYFYNADKDNISIRSTTYTINLTKSDTITTYPFKPTRCIYHNHDIFYDGDDDEELFPVEVKRIQQILEKTSDEKSSSDEDVPKENFKKISNPLSDEETISTKIDPHHFNKESDHIESLLNRDTLIISSPKFDSLLEEFSSELAHIDLIPPGIIKADLDTEEDIHLVERLLYDNSSPQPPEEFNSKNFDVIIESFSPSPIPVEDSDSFMEKINLFLTPDDSMPPCIVNDDYDSEGDILFLEELLSNDSPSLLENKSFHFDVSSFPRPPAKPLDDGI